MKKQYICYRYKYKKLIKTKEDCYSEFFFLKLSRNTPVTDSKKEDCHRCFWQFYDTFQSSHIYNISERITSDMVMIKI